MLLSITKILAMLFLKMTFDKLAHKGFYSCKSAPWLLSIIYIYSSLPYDMRSSSFWSLKVK